MHTHTGIFFLGFHIYIYKNYMYFFSELPICVLRGCGLQMYVTVKSHNCAWISKNEI